MYELYCGEKKLFMHGNRVSKLIREAGFVDVEVRIIKIEIGEWGEGRFNLGFQKANGIRSQVA
jgi:hypothetical protein